VATIAKTVEGSNIVASMFASFLDPGHDLRSQASQIKGADTDCLGEEGSDYTSRCL
jgi:hypothetical protein